MSAHKTILIVDDEPGHRILINRGLRANGYNTISVQNAEEALAALWEKDHIGLVLLDVRLPIINGLNIFEIIRKEFPDKKIIVISVLQKDEQKFLIYDADDYYDKSEDMSRLLEKVNNIFNNTMAGRSRENEKRNSKRIPVNALASCQRVNHDSSGRDTHFLSYTKDLSRWGGKFILNEDIKVGQHFTAALELPVNFLPLLIDCEVMWVRKLEEFVFQSNGNVEAGVRFVKLDSSRDEEKLENYLSYV